MSRSQGTRSVARTRRATEREDGMVLLEFALVVPMVMCCCLFALWLLRMGQVQAQLDDATRAAARELARGGSMVAAQRAGGLVLPGVVVAADTVPGGIAVSGRYHLSGPIPLLAEVGAHLAADMVVAPEPTP